MTTDTAHKNAPKGALKLARRTFLIGAAALTGGVAFGVYAYRKDLPNPLVPDAGEATLNPYLIITHDGYKIITPRAEMGQGVHTTLAALVAEELDVPWGEIEAIHGPASATYYNSHLLRLTMPFRDYALTKGQERILAATDIPAKFFGMQITAGSTTIMEGFDKMRIAGAAARQMLIRAAADQWGVDASSLTTDSGFVVRPTGEKRSYKRLAQAAAKVDPPKDVALKPQSEWTLLGTSLDRLDIPGKVDGSAVYSIDIRKEDQLFASLRLAPRAGGTLTSCDLSPAKDMPGVKSVFTLGDEGIAAIATNTWYAMAALDVLEPEWAYPDTLNNSDAYWAEIENALEDAPHSILREDGAAQTALGQAHNVVTAEYRVPFLSHAQMEPVGATVLYTDQRIDIWVGHQGPTIARDLVAKQTGLSADDIHVHVQLMGGSFGRRGEADYILTAVSIAEHMKGIPIQTTYARSEDMTQGVYRPAFIARGQGIVEDGKAKALSLKIAGQSVNAEQMKRFTGFVPPGADKLLLDGAFTQPYQIENFYVAGHVAELPVPIGSWRSVGVSHNAYFIECFVDELAAAAQQDPLAFRLDMVRQEDPVSAAVLEEVATFSGWSKPVAVGYGRGVAFTYYLTSPVAVVVTVRDEGGAIKIEDVWTVADVGTLLDPRNAEAQITSGIVFGLSAAVMQEITFRDGAAQQSNYDSFDALRMGQAPRMHTRFLQSGKKISGVGESSTGPIMAALANAVYDLTGNRIRTLPMANSVAFV